MKFHQYKSLFDQFREMPAFNQMFHNLSKDALRRTIRSLAEQSVIELQSVVPMKEFRHNCHWVDCEKPYYSVYPKLAKPLSNLRLDRVKMKDISFPLSVMCFRLAEDDKNFMMGELPLRSLLVSRETELDPANETCVGLPVVETPGKTVGPEQITIWMDFGEVDESGSPLSTFRRFCGQPTDTVMDCLNRWNQDYTGNYHPDAKILDEETCNRITSLVCAISLISDDEMVTPDLLNRDNKKQFKPEMIERAHRHGKVGWTVGEKYEVTPHLRSPCPAALYWTGPGKQIPIIRTRAGCMVHREVAEKIPTGYESIEKRLDREGNE